jgi:hypothetical protein
MADNQPAPSPIQEPLAGNQPAPSLTQGRLADNQLAPSPIQKPLADSQTVDEAAQPAEATQPTDDTLPTEDTLPAEATQPAIGVKTIGTDPISKKQPWRDLVQQQTFAQPGFFTSTPSAEDTDKIRLLPELDSKSR